MNLHINLSSSNQGHTHGPCKPALTQRTYFVLHVVHIDMYILFILLVQKGGFLLLRLLCVFFLWWTRPNHSLTTLLLTLKQDATSKIGLNRTALTGPRTIRRWRGGRGWLDITCIPLKVSSNRRWGTASSGSRTNSQTNTAIHELIIQAKRNFWAYSFSFPSCVYHQLCDIIWIFNFVLPLSELLIFFLVRFVMFDLPWY